MSSERTGQRPLPIMTEVFRRRAEERPDAAELKIAGRPLPYGTIFTEACRFAGGLRGLGVERGDRIATMLPNRLEALATWIGAANLGAIEVGLSSAAQGPRLEYPLALTRPRALVIHEEYLERLDGISLPDETRVAVVGDGGELPAGAITYAEMVDSPEVGPLAELTASDPGSIVFTSGTTGPSKGVVCSFGHMAVMGVETIEIFELTEADVVFDAHPLYHAHAKCQGVLAAAMCGCRLVMPDRFSASGFVPTLHEEGVTMAFLVGSAGLVMKQPPRPEDARSPLRVICAIPIPPEQHRAIEARFGCPVIDEYGSTEMGVVTATPLDDRRPGACGKPTRRRELLVVDEDGHEVPPGVKGEIIVRPTEPSAFFLEYFEMPAETVAINRDLFFHSGDYGKKDADGHVYFLGRKKDAIRRRGENISAVEIEQILDSHPAVAKSAIIGLPSEVGEEDVWAIVQPLEGMSVEPGELWEFCRTRMEKYAVPRYVQIEESLPLTSTGRVEKWKVRDAGLPGGTFDAEAQTPPRGPVAAG